MGFGVWGSGSGFRGFGVWGLGFVKNRKRFRIWSSGLRVEGTRLAKQPPQLKLEKPRRLEKLETLPILKHAHLHTSGRDQMRNLLFGWYIAALYSNSCSGGLSEDVLQEPGSLVGLFN